MKTSHRGIQTKHQAQKIEETVEYMDNPNSTKRGIAV